MPRSYYLYYTTITIYRYMDEYKYIVNIDNDEMILSLNHTSWADMMEDLEIETENKVNFGVQQKTNLLLTH